MGRQRQPAGLGASEVNRSPLAPAKSPGRLQFLGVHVALADAKAFAEWMTPLRKCEWVVYAKRPFVGPQAVLAYLSRYTHRVAISNSRLLAMNERGVTFRWKDYRVKDGAKGKTRHKTMTLDADEFMRRFLPVDSRATTTLARPMIELVVRCRTAGPMLHSRLPAGTALAARCRSTPAIRIRPSATRRLGPAARLCQDWIKERDGRTAATSIDAPLCVHRVQGMRGVDASVMPRIVSGNINPPVIMVAENAAMFPGAGGGAARPHAGAPGRCRADRARLG